MLLINWKPPPPSAPCALLSCDSSDQVNIWICHIFGHTTVFHQPRCACVPEFNKLGAASARARFILAINWEPPPLLGDGYPGQSSICQPSNPFTLQGFFHRQSLLVLKSSNSLKRCMSNCHRLEEDVTCQTLFFSQFPIYSKVTPTHQQKSKLLLKAGLLLVCLLTQQLCSVVLGQASMHTAHCRCVPTNTDSGNAVYVQLLQYCGLEPIVSTAQWQWQSWMGGELVR